MSGRLPDFKLRFGRLERAMNIFVELYCAAVAFIRWKKRLIRAIRNGIRDEVYAELSDAKNSEFGKWLAARGHAMRRRSPRMLEAVERLYTETQRLGARALELSAAGSHRTALAMLRKKGEFERLSRRLVYTLLEWRRRLTPARGAHEHKPHPQTSLTG